jgi:hypothetical protein
MEAARGSRVIELEKNMKVYTAVSNYSNRAGGAMSSGPYCSRARAEEAAIAMTARGYETVRIVESDDNKKRIASY